MTLEFLFSNPWFLAIVLPIFSEHHLYTNMLYLLTYSLHIQYIDITFTINDNTFI